MSKIIKESDMAPGIPEAVTSGRMYLYCPGCYAAAQAHNPDEPRYWIHAAAHCFSNKVHEFNGDMERPTLSPSVLYRSVRSKDRRIPDGPTTDYVCHSFVRDGKIEFLSDCTHPLAGLTVDLMDAPEPEVEV